MRVLDVGSGAGDVALLAAEIVGTSGKVIGSDKSEAALSHAELRVSRLGLGNVRFVHGDPTNLSFDEPFDAVIGRSVLMYCREPQLALKRLLRHLRPGGIMAFQEVNFGSAQLFPEVMLFRLHDDWVSRILSSTGVHLRMGLELYSAFLSAGVVPNGVRADAPVVGAEDARAEKAFQVLAGVLEALCPVAKELGVIMPPELDPATFAARLLAQFRSSSGVMVWNQLIGVWACKSGADPGR